MIKYLRPRIRFFAYVFIWLLLFQFGFPIGVFALTDGPKSPEFSKFEPVAITDMVNHFSGDFSYNIPVLNVPGPEGAGYSLSLSYKSGAGPEQESSWVGAGWTLNPGAINRDMRGIPDDYEDVEIIRYNKTYPNWTVSTSASIGNLEIFGFDVQASAGTSLRLNNNQGFQRAFDFGLSYQGLVNLNMAVSPQGNTYSANINPIAYLQKMQEENKEKENSDSKKNDTRSFSESVSQFGPASKNLLVSKLANKAIGSASSATTVSTSSFGIFTFSEAVRNTTFSNYTGSSYNRATSVQVNPAIFPVGGELGFNGNFNYQLNQPEVTFEANGFLNSRNSSSLLSKDQIEISLLDLISRSSDNGLEQHFISDYYVEKEGPYQKRDYFLGVPFSSPDNFLVTSEQLGGGFRYYQNNLGHFYPNLGNSHLSTDSRGLEFMVGTDIGIGLDFGLGGQSFYSSRWALPGNSDQYQYDDNGAFRFNNDLGGKIEYGENTSTETARLLKVLNQDIAIDIPGTLYKNNEQQLQDRGLSSYIDFHTVADLVEGERFTAQSLVLDNIADAYENGTSKITNDQTICEFQITKPDGSNYSFIPVFNANEVSVQVEAEVSSRSPCLEGEYSNCVLNNHLIFQNLAYSEFPEIDLDQHKIVIGDVKKEPYAGLFLLTQITSPDFIDRQNNGPDETDFGGWTKFSYHDLYNLENPYRWRTPYSGLLYSKNGISNTQDDVASIFTGEKEVKILASIETKSHIAVFIHNQSIPEDFLDVLPESFPETSFELLRGSQELRKDGHGATAVMTSSDPQASNAAETGAQPLVYLEKIILFSKSRPARPVVTTRFAYDYSLAKGLPNNIESNYPFNSGQGYLQSGKLTLEKVWFEYEGNHPTQISPYHFNYQYRNNFPGSLVEQYPWLADFDRGLDESDQNPDYSPFLLNAWGLYQTNGEYRKNQMIPWPSQRKHENQDKFDPAAWQLKRIRLPSGGEILVDYEEKDYQYVQDRNAMGMTSLISADFDNNSFVINVEDIGVDPMDLEQVSLLRQKCHDMYVNSEDSKEKIYFKFLFSFKENIPGLDNCDSEYIKGYAEVEGVYVYPAGNNEWHLRFQLNLDDNVRPSKACYDFYTTQRFGFEEKKVQTTTNGQETYACTLPLNQGFGQSSDVLTTSLTNTLLENQGGDYENLSDEVMDLLSSNILNFGGYSIPGSGDVCKNIDPVLSYLKVPMITPKRGAGVRVKRLLMYDPGIESGDPAIYGNEYAYQNEDGTSSGVATNEPSSMREENALVSFLPRDDQSWFSRLTAGEDLKQTEGPIGESILPPPSVGHSRVEVNNIYEGVTGSGLQVFDYHTVKDYPFDKYYNNVTNNDIAAGKGVDHTQLSDNLEEEQFNIPAILFNYSTSQMWASQGFRFIINSMHGQPKAEQIFGQSAEGSHYLSSSKRYEYYEPGDSVYCLQPDGSFLKDNPGKEMDVTMEAKSLYSNTLNFTIEIDVSISLSIIPLIALTAIPSIGVSENRINTHLTSKVTRYPATLKSIDGFIDGTFQRTEFLAFDKYNGQPVLTRTSDEYDRVVIEGEKWDGSLYSLQIPASHNYQAMRSRHLNLTNSNQLDAITANYTTYGIDGNPLIDENGNLGAGTITDLRNVLSADVQTFSNHLEWFNDQSLMEKYALDDYALGELQQVWRPHETYLFKADRIPYEPQAGTYIYEAGMIKGFSNYAWEEPENNQSNGWQLQSKILKYSPHGMPIEEVDIFERHYSIKYSPNYNFIVPSIRAANARYNNIAFQDFESAFNFTHQVISSSAHSGKLGYQVRANADYVTTESLPLGAIFYSKKLQESRGAWIKVWVKNLPVENPMFIRVNNSEQSGIRMEKVASTGEWSLYRALISPEKFEEEGRLQTGSRITIHLITENDIVIDDLKFQPYDSQASCFVYDQETFRLIAQFDDQHFGMYYRYNAEGQLIYKEIETERGLKTIQETQYHTPKRSIKE